MRFLFVLAIPVIVVGCISMAFDNREYDGYLEIAESAERLSKQCENFTEVQQGVLPLTLTISHMVAYSSGRELARPNFATAAHNLGSLSNALAYHYKASMPPSTAYCQSKLTYISAAARVIALELGRL